MTKKFNTQNAILIFCIVLLALTLFYQAKSLLVEPKERTMTLLAASGDSPSTYKGEVAEMSLKIKRGDGKVAINTEPLTQLDTQISMRFAQQFACDYLKIDCSDKDFFYKIKANSNIIGGPSAGAAATVLTISALSNQDLKNDIAMTGTINSGGAIGPVGALKEKIEAAASKRFEKVLIPQGTSNFKRNGTDINLGEYGKEKNIRVIEVSDIDEALTQFGFNIPQREIADYNNSEFQKLMKQISDNLCSRAKSFSDRISFTNRSNDSQKLLDQEKYYAASSFCFIDNINAQEAFLVKRNHTVYELKSLIDELRFKIKGEEIELKNRKINTISDLQTNMIISERLSDAKDGLKEVEESLNTSNKVEIDVDLIDMDFLNQTSNKTSLPDLRALAFVNERLETIKSWKFFYNLTGKKIVLDDNLKDTCDKKISEADERHQYSNLFLTGDRNNEALGNAKKNRDDKDYASCIFQASKSKAEANTIISSIGVTQENLNLVIKTKLKLAAKSLKERNSEHISPILGNSYLEYGEVLSERNETISLLYAEYALEFSDLDVYFPEKSAKRARVSQEVNLYFNGLVAGILIGLMAFLALNFNRKR